MRPMLAGGAPRYDLARRATMEFGAQCGVFALAAAERAIWGGVI